MEKFDISNRMFALLGATILVVALLIGGFLAVNYKSLPQNSSQDIVVSASGKAFIKPDIAKVNMGVKTEAIRSQEAVDQNNVKMNAVIKAIKEQGVEDKDIQTTMYNLSPIYDWTESGRIFRGYSLEQQVSVKIRNFEKINSILDKASTAGANTVGDLQFTVDDLEQVRSQARSEAIEKAKQKAQSIANLAGLKLGKLVNVQESNYDYPQPLYGIRNAISMEKSTTAPDIQTGQMEVNITVSLTYKVR